MMGNNEVLVIDDVGDVIDDFSIAFNDNTEFESKFSSSDFEDLKNHLDLGNILILINEDGLQNDLNEVINFIRKSFFHLSVPIVILSSDANFVDDVKNSEIPIINHISKPINMDAFKGIVSYIMEIFESNINTNSVSGLPGNNLITRKIQHELDIGSNFALLYLDLDNFKAFADYHGSIKSNNVILELSNILFNVVLDYGAFEDFIGHIGGDDFVVILNDKTRADAIGNAIVKRFDEKIVDFYSKEDLERGYIETNNRDGVLEKFGITSISIIIVDYRDFLENPLDKIYEKMMRLKKEAKKVKGSVFLNER